MDALNHVLSALRLKSNFIYRAELPSPWGIKFSITNAAMFHLVEKGDCWLRIPEPEQTIALSTGDLIVVSGTDHYEIVDDLRTTALPLQTFQAQHSRLVEATLNKDAANMGTLLVSGEFRPEHDVIYPLFSLIPRLILIKNQQGRAIDWLKSPLESISWEAQHCYPGYELVVSRLMDILFIMVMRYCIAHHVPEDGGWLRALYEPRIGEVLSLIHRQPEHPWTVEELADVAHMSRSAFNDLFSGLVGEAPMKYLTRWRLQLAITYLADERKLPVEQIAHQVGYASPYAFSKAFKRVVHTSPTAYRKQYLQRLKQE